MNESDLVKIRTALEKETVSETIEAMKQVIGELGYIKVDRKAEPPKEPRFYDDALGEAGRQGYKHCERIMLKADWVKEVEDGSSA